MAYDPATEEVGVAVQSKVLAVGAIVPWTEAKVGGVATQALANPTYGPRGLALLRQGKSATQVLAALIAADPDAARRQALVIDATGQAAAHTGAGCFPYAGHTVGKHFAAAGNLLVGKAVVDAMATAFTTTPGPLAERLLAALAAGQKAGGDKRGRQSAALKVARKGWGYLRLIDRFRDLRVDDHPKPIEELTRLYRLARKQRPHPVHR